MQGKKEEVKKGGAGASSLTQAQMSQKKFELENEVIEEELYQFSEEETDKMFRDKPWTKDPHLFKRVKISATALVKMVMHTRRGGDLEVMGLMQGKIKGDTFYVMDSFGLPVEGTETRVNAGSEANEFMGQHMTFCDQTQRPENICGWYHSHPGYGCWLSGIDVGTQTLYQKFQEPFIAIVIDPKRTMSAGKVEIGCFRVFPDSYIAQLEKNNKAESGSKSMVPADKIGDFGLHAYKYYQLEHSFFKSKLDLQILEALWNEYWAQTLASSPLLNNSEYLTKAISNIATKMDQITEGSSSRAKGAARQKKASEDGGISSEKLSQIEKESTKCCLEMNHGLLVEALKNFMFTQPLHPSAQI